MPNTILETLDELDALQKAMIDRAFGHPEGAAEFMDSVPKETVEFAMAYRKEYPTISDTLRRALACITDICDDNIHTNTHIRNILVKHKFMDSTSLTDEDNEKINAYLDDKDKLRRALALIEDVRKMDDVKNYGDENGIGAEVISWKSQRTAILRKHGFEEKV
jgi:hypothetical protein